jgi:hypothetical protein
MTIEAISFLIGGILIGTAIVGGGFEIKEIKMPRVGAGVRVVSLVVGSAFVMLGLGIWGVNNPQLIADQAPVNALMPANGAAQATGQASSQPEPQTREAARPEVNREVVEPAQEQVDWAPQTAPVFTGFDGSANISWTADGVTYYGTAKFYGGHGILRVSYLDPSTQMQSQVDQDLVLQTYEGVSWYMGSNPRESSSQAALDETQYLPDNFRVVLGNKGWTMDQTCFENLCYPVSVQGQ